MENVVYIIKEMILIDKHDMVDADIFTAFKTKKGALEKIDTLKDKYLKIITDKFNEDMKLNEDIVDEVDTVEWEGLIDISYVEYFYRAEMYELTLND